jgi:hypothetical protein
MYFYNGAGVGVGDFNNDGLQDIFFSSNQGDNSLFLNKGGMRFSNVTKEAGHSFRSFMEHRVFRYCGY